MDVWIHKVQACMEEARKVNKSGYLSDSLSVAGSKAEMQRVALVAQAPGLKQKHALEKQEAKIKSEKETVEIDTALAAADAKLKVLQMYKIKC